MTKNKVFLDTSVLIAALHSSRGGSLYILSQLKNEFKFQINEYVLEEVFEVLNRKFPNRDDLKTTFFILFGLAKVKILSNPKPLSLKPFFNLINEEDIPILASAILESDYLLTLDGDFLEEKVKDFARRQDTLILTPREFIQRIR